MAGSTAASLTLTEGHEVAMGWSTLPRFDDATDRAVRDPFSAAAVDDIGRARRHLATLQKAVAAAEANAQVRLLAEIDQLQRDMRVAEGKLAEMQKACVGRWKDFRAALGEAVDRMHSGSGSAVPG